MGETAAFAHAAQQAFEENGSWDMASLESGLRQALMRDGCSILQTLLNQPAALGEYEPKGSLHDHRTRTVHSLLGSFRLTRGYYRNAEASSSPMDDVLGLVGSYSPGLAKLMCRAAGMDGSYEEAEQTLGLYAGVCVPASQIRCIVQSMGPELKKWSETRGETRCEQVPKLYVSYDGTGVPMRKEETKGRKGKQADGSSASREVKLGCVFTGTVTDEEGLPLRDPQSTSYLASFEPAETFGLSMLKEARLRGLGKAEKSVVIGDGAHWIWRQAGINFPEAVQILDYYHAREHLGVLAEAVFPAEEERGRELEKWIDLLDKGKIGKIADCAGKQKARSGKRRVAAEREIEYFRKNAKRMQYARFREQGLFIGSGVVEAGCKTVVGKRTKQSGMFWKIRGAQNILDIRCAVLSDTYDDYWEWRKARQAQALKVAA
ncbi:ISKra4 family transposase [Pontiellaceae bacterium B1224]|nr:ISKra4 family transposase [Pontiellaceae bacterium B1224]